MMMASKEEVVDLAETVEELRTQVQELITVNRELKDIVSHLQADLERLEEYVVSRFQGVVHKIERQE